MEIAVLYHSQTGKTKLFAEGIAAKLAASGHNVQSTHLQTIETIKGGSVRQQMKISFENLPDVSTADLILFGGPVWAFGASPVIIAAIKALTGLQGKNALSFITMGFPFKCMGGNASLRYMDRELATKGMRVLQGAICTNRNLQEGIVQEAERICSLVNNL